MKEPVNQPNELEDPRVLKENDAAQVLIEYAKTNHIMGTISPPKLAVKDHETGLYYSVISILADMIIKTKRGL